MTRADESYLDFPADQTFKVNGYYRRDNSNQVPDIAFYYKTVVDLGTNLFNLIILKNPVASLKGVMSDTIDLLNGVVSHISYIAKILIQKTKKFLQSGTNIDLKKNKIRKGKIGGKNIKQYVDRIYRFA